MLFKNSCIFPGIVLFVISFCSFVIADTPSPYGVCAHVSRPSDHGLAEQEFELMRKAGIRWARTDFDWTTVQPSQAGEWDFSMLDDTVKMADEADISILPILAYDVPWASPAYQHLDEWLEYVRRTVSRYKDKLRYWEVWNEPDLEGFWRDTPDPANYTKLLKATYREIKKIDPNLKVLSAGFSGIPYEYIEGIYKAGGGNFFDIMAVHPYRYPASPESVSLENDLEKLRELMTKYGDGSKPIWITEIGWPTHRNQSDLLEEIVHTGLETVHPNRKKWTLAVFDEPDYPGYINLSDHWLKDILPGNGRIVRLNIKQMQNLSPEKYHALMLPPGEGFPAAVFDDIERYVHRGGIAVFTNGVPLYYKIHRTGDGGWERQGADESYRKRLHIGWEAWWTQPNVPKSLDSLFVPESFRSEIALPKETPSAERFLTDSAVKPGDRFIPLLKAGKNDYTGTAAAVYDLNSDLKGAVIVSTMFQDFRGVSESRQAEIIPRAYLIALHTGVEKMFWYNFRARENDPYYNEDHFGIIHKNLTPKPAYRSMQTLSYARPAGSVCVGTEWRNGNIFYPGWERPDGKTVYALWTSGFARKIRVNINGSILEAYNYFGRELDIKTQDEEVSVRISGKPMYLTGPEEIEIIASEL